MVTREGVREGSGRVAHGSSVVVSQCLSLCCPHVLPHLPRPARAHLLQAVATSFAEPKALPAALRPMLGPAELLLPSSSKQSKLQASFHSINTHNPPHCLQLIPPLALPFPSARQSCATTSSIICSNTHSTHPRPPDPTTLGAFQRV